MTIKYLRDTLFVSHGVSFENKGTYELPEDACRELHSTFVGYFELQKEVTKPAVDVTKESTEEQVTTKKPKK